MRGRAVLVAYVAAAIGAALVAVPVARLVLPGPAGAAPPAPTTPSAPVFTPNLQVAGQPSPPPATVHAPADPAAIKAPGYVTFFGWSLLDRHSGAATGSANREKVTNTAESMIKVWIVADYLRHHGPAAASAIPELTKVIVNSDDDLAYKFYEQDGGDGAIRELVSVCGLHSTRPPYLADRWSYTTISPADAMRLGQCVASGTAAGPNWTNWLLDTMRKVNGGVADQQRSSGGGHWGIIDTLPPPMVAHDPIKERRAAP